MEYLETFSKNGKKTGKVEKRSIIHQRGFWHRVVHIWIYNNKGEILIQKRSLKKDVFPCKWDISAAGHIDVGESPIEAAIRETAEELGIILKERDLNYIGKLNISFLDNKNNVKDNEITYIFSHLTKLEIYNFKIDTSEISEIKYIKIGKLIEQLQDSKGAMYNFVPFSREYIEFLTDYFTKRHPA